MTKEVSIDFPRLYLKEYIVEKNIQLFNDIMSEILNLDAAGSMDYEDRLSTVNRAIMVYHRIKYYTNPLGELDTHDILALAPVAVANGYNIKDKTGLKGTLHLVNKLDNTINKYRLCYFHIDEMVNNLDTETKDLFDLYQMFEYNDAHDENVYDRLFSQIKKEYGLDISDEEMWNIHVEKD